MAEEATGQDEQLRPLLMAVVLTLPERANRFRLIQELHSHGCHDIRRHGAACLEAGRAFRRQICGSPALKLPHRVTFGFLAGLEPPIA